MDLSQNEAVVSYDRELDEEELKENGERCRLQSGQCEINLLNNASERTDIWAKTASVFYLLLSGANRKIMKFMKFFVDYALVPA